MPPVNINLDPGALAQAIITALLDGVQNLLSSSMNSFLVWLGLQLENIWDNVWASGANMLATPFELTKDFAPAQMLGQNLFLAVYAITSLAIVLLALRNLWHSFNGGSGFMTDAANGILIGILLAGGSTIIVGQAYALTLLASNAIGRFNYVTAFGPRNLTFLVSDMLWTLFGFLIMFLYSWKLIIRAAYRLVLLMFLTPFAPVAGILWGIPQLRWIARAYYITLGGWLAGGVLAIGAISLGVQIVGFETGGIMTIIFGVALVQLAHDLMSILPTWAFGQVNANGAGGMAARAFGLVASAATGGAAGAATGAAAGAAGGGAAGFVGGGGAMMGGPGAIGALSAASLGPGYD